MSARRRNAVIIVLFATSVHSLAQEPSDDASASRIVYEQRLWPPDRPFTSGNLRAWAQNSLAQRSARPRFLRVTTGVDAKELASAWSGRLSDTDFGSYYGDAKKYWPKHPIAVLTAFDGKAAVQLQSEGVGYASEDILIGASSPSVILLNGKRFRLLHLDGSHYSSGIPIAAFVQSELPITDFESGAGVLRLLAAALSVAEIRIVIRPDCWFVDESYPYFFRFPMDFGISYFSKPNPPSPRWFFGQPELTCERRGTGEIRCSRVATVHERAEFKQ